MKLVHQEDRAKSTLRAVIAFGKERPRWPGADQLHRFRKRIGSRATVQRTLATLRDLGLLAIDGAGHTRRWRPTAAGFEYLHQPPFVPAQELRQHREDAAAILAAPVASRLTKATVLKNPTSVPTFAMHLAVHE